LIDIGQRVVIYDYKSDYLSKFYRPKKDIIFNPLDARGLEWNLFNEIKTRMDIDAIAASLIPPPISTSDPFWNDAARGVFAGIL
jgi:type IV secretory pathway TraG/TraD family ATPase VirD4